MSRSSYSLQGAGAAICKDKIGKNTPLCSETMQIYKNWMWIGEGVLYKGFPKQDDGD